MNIDLLTALQNRGTAPAENAACEPLPLPDMPVSSGDHQLKHHARDFEAMMDQAAESASSLDSLPSAAAQLESSRRHDPDPSGHLIEYPQLQASPLLHHPAPVATSMAISHTAAMEKIQQLLEMIAVTLQSDARSGVTLTLAQDVLPDTTITLIRTAETLEVTLTLGPEAREMLPALDLSSLAQRLADVSQGLDVRITVPSSSGFEPAAYFAPSSSQPQSSKKHARENRKD